MKKVRTLDLFHGAGGSSAGAQAAGARIVAGIDVWNIASDCYHRNFPRAQAINADIRDISPKELHGHIGDIDLIIASPECTNHTCAKGSAERSEESRLTAFEVVRFAAEFMPKWVVLENVVHMQSWDAYPKLIGDFEKLGYQIRVEKLNAMDFGVPQSRRRLFLMCSLSGVPQEIVLPGRKVVPASSVIDLNGRYSLSPLYSPRRAVPTIERARRAMAELGEEGHFIIVYYGTDQSGGWQSVDRPLRTVTTLDRFAYVKPSPDGPMMRMLQPEELKLAMGLPSLGI
jgi:DNA (cytosine-5)-methyltransferase 1